MVRVGLGLVQLIDGNILSLMTCIMLNGTGT